MRALSVAARRAVFAPETSEVFLTLLTISGAGLGIPLRFVNDRHDQVSRGNTYFAWPFRIALPDEREDSPAQVSLTIDNIDRSIVAAVRQLTQAPSIKLEVVLASSPDTIEAGPFDFTLRSVEYDVLLVSGKLSFEDVLNEPYPADSFDPTRFGGLFAA